MGRQGVCVVPALNSFECTLNVSSDLCWVATVVSVVAMMMVVLVVLVVVMMVVRGVGAAGGSTYTC